MAAVLGSCAAVLVLIADETTEIKVLLDLFIYILRSRLKLCHYTRFEYIYTTDA